MSDDLTTDQQLKAKEDLYASDSDDDDILLSAGLSTPPKQQADPPPSQAPTSASSTESPLQQAVGATAESPGETLNDEEREREAVDEQARRHAKRFVESQERNFQVIQDPSQLKWHIFRSDCYPCRLATDPAEYAGYTGLKVTTKNDTIVRYIGYQHRDNTLFYAVSSKQLKPYNDGDEDDDTKWSALLMQRFLESIKTQSAFKSQTYLKLKTEEYVLQFILDFVRDARAARLSRKAMQAAEPSHDSEDDESSDESDDESPEPPPVVRPSCVNVDPRAAMQARENQVKVLRAGDGISFFEPNMKASREYFTRATIVEVFPGQEMALKMSNGMMIPRDCQVTLEKRLLRGKVIDNTGATAMYVSDFRLDKSMNGKVNVETPEDKLGSIMEQAKAEMDSAWRDAFQGGGDEDEDDREAAAKDYSGERYLAEEDSKPAAKDGPKKRAAVEKRGHKHQQEPPSKKRYRPLWIPHLERCLAEARKKGERRRCDKEKVETEISSLKMAKKARHRLDELSSPKKTVEMIVKEIAKDWEISYDTMWYYLTGNTKEFLSSSALKEMTAEWEKWLLQTGEASVV